MFNKTLGGLIAASVFALTSSVALADEKTIVGTAVDTPALSTLVAAVQAADLVDALSGDGPFTVFAPTNDAFGKLPAGTVESLLEPEAKDTLTKILTAHVVAGKLTAADLVSRINHTRAKRYNFQTLSGDALTAVLRGGHVYIFDESGGAALVVTADVMTSNGVVHVVNDVLLPK